MFTYFPETGHATSDANTFDDWAYEIALGREAWLTAWAKKIVPDHVFKKVHQEATTYQITRWMRDNGYRLVENKQTMHWAIMHDDEVVTQFKVCLVAPKPNCCRYCGQPLTLGAEKEVHGLCQAMEGLEAKWLRNKRVQKPESN